MFNVKHRVEAVLSWLGEPASPEIRERLTRYRTWLIEEAVPAGGLGPAEVDRIDDRHLADSLAFGAVLPRHTKIVADLGSGVGLPGIPLAILRPESQFVLIDRSQKRCDLTARVVRIMRLDNVEVRLREIADESNTFDGITMRAALPMDRAIAHIARLLNAGGTAAVGWRRLGYAADATELASLVESAHAIGLQVDSVLVPMLDSPASVLRMIKRDSLI